jgi:hypothetical protein
MFTFLVALFLCIIMLNKDMLGTLVLSLTALAIFNVWAMAVVFCIGYAISD